jgi:hypothetical protein
MTAVDDVVVTPRVRADLRRWRAPVVIAVLVVVLSVLLALAQGQRTRGYLDPGAVDPSGAGALASLLEDQGVAVVRVTTAEAARDALYDAEGGSTLLVAAELSPISEEMADVATQQRPAHLVLLGADATTLELLAPWARTDGFALPGEDGPEEVDPACAWDLATRVGPLAAEGQLYATSAQRTSSCWGGYVLDLPEGVTGDPATTLVGSGSLLTNDVLADSGNAALGMNLLGRDSTVVWWLPSYTDPLQAGGIDEPVAISDLVPPWVGIALAQAVVALLVAVWWRGRRLGRVVVEPLPVVVRATETAEGRGRLYRRSGARGRAADVLREASTSRLRALLALPRAAGLDEVVPAVAARTGRDPAAVASLLAPGNDPSDDASLTRLADALDILEDEVRRS